MKRSISKSRIRIAALPWIAGHGASFVFMVLALAALIFSSVNPQSASGLRSGAVDVFSPTLSALSQPVQDAALFVRNVTGLSELQAENLRLQQENMKLRDWYQAAQILESENKALRDLMNVKLEPRNTYITARIFADSGQAFAKSLLVSAGQEDGVRKGQAVIAVDGLIGRVVEAGVQTARVLLVTDINSRVPVFIESTSQQAILSGDGDQMPMLSHLPPDADVKVGDRVITSGLGGVFPKGIPVGRVVFDRTGAPRIQLFADFDRMMYVRVVNRPEDPNLMGAR